MFMVLLAVAMQMRAQKIEVVSQSTAEPIPFASAYFLQSKIATVTDENGVIDVDIPDNDTLIIRHIGYKEKRVAGGELSKCATIKMEQTDVQLSEVVVKPMSALQLVKKVRDFIPVNYPQAISRYNLSVENMITVGDSVYCCLRGSVVCTTFSYTKGKPCEYRLVEADAYINNRGKYNFHLPYRVGAYPANLIEQMHLNSLDFIKNVGDYQYSFADEHGRNERTIHFSPKKASQKHYVEGMIIVSMQDMAIKRIEYTTAMPDVVAYDEKVVSVGLGVKVYSEGKHCIKTCDTKLSFEKVGGRYQLTYATNRFQYRYEKKDGQTVDYSAENSVVNHFGDVRNVEEYRPIALYGYDLREWTQNNIKTPRQTKYLSRKISRTIQMLKEKYPEVDVSEIE